MLWGASCRPDWWRVVVCRRPAYLAMHATAQAKKPVLTVEDVLRSRVENAQGVTQVQTFTLCLDLQAKLTGACQVTGVMSRVQTRNGLAIDRRVAVFNLDLIPHHRVTLFATSSLATALLASPCCSTGRWARTCS